VRSSAPLDPQRVLVARDTAKDIAAAHAARAIGIGVASGHYSEESSAKPVPTTSSALSRSICPGPPRRWCETKPTVRLRWCGDE